MLKNGTWVLGGALMCCVSAASAEGIAAGVKVGTLGFGVEVTAGISDNIAGRVNFNKYNWSTDTTSDQIKYDIELGLKSFMALLDWHPFNGSFRASAGLVANGNEINMTATPTGSYEVGGVTYTAAEVGNLTGKVDFNSTAPYLGIGWGRAVGKGKSLSFNVDLGILFQGTPKLDLNATGTLATDATFQADLAEEEANAQEDLNGFNRYPVASFGIAYQF